MKGLVLCGGTSTRMGEDKGLLLQSNQRWVEIAAEKLKSLSLPVVISVNTNQIPAYAAIFGKEHLVVDNALPVKGPLLGLLSVHLNFPAEDLLVLACDLKDMNLPLLQNLFAHSTDKQEAFVYSTNEKAQPLCGIYTSRGLKKILERLLKGELQKFSMMHVLEQLDTTYIATEKKDWAAFANYNSAGDLSTV